MNLTDDANNWPVMVGEIVQLGPVVQNQMFTGCLMVVTEPQDWGAVGYVQGIGQRGVPGHVYHYRASWAEMQSTGGTVAWIHDAPVEVELR